MSNKGWYSTKGRVCYLIFTAGVMTLIAICIIRVWTQHKRITSCRKAEGIVLEKKIEKIKYGAHRGVSTTYEPKIKYQYEVDGQRYVCNNLTPVIQGSRGKHTWAQSVVEKFKIGQTIQVYYNPENPQEAFIIRDYSFHAYGPAFLLMLPLSIMILAYYENEYMEDNEEALYDPQHGKWKWVPKRSFAFHFRKYLMLFGLWNLLGILLFTHYFYYAYKPFKKFPIIVCIVYEGLGLAGLAFVLYSKFFIEDKKTYGIQSAFE